MEYNRFVDYWETKRNWNIHSQKLKTMKPVLKTIRVSHPLADKNKSRNLGYNYRQLQIQIQNKALLAKIAKSQSSSQPVKQISNEQIFRKTNKRKYFQNYEIQIENRDLLNKLKNIKPSYNTKKLVEDYKKKQNYMNLMCKFPLRGLKPTKTYLKLQMINSRVNPGRMSANSSPEKYAKQQIYQINGKQVKKGDNQKYYTHQTQRKQIQRQKIRKIFPIKKIRIKNMVGIVKGILYESFLEAQIVMDDKQKQTQIIILQVDEFLQKFNNSFKSLCQSITFDENSNCFSLN